MKKNHKRVYKFTIIVIIFLTFSLSAILLLSAFNYVKELKENHVRNQTLIIEQATNELNEHLQQIDTALSMIVYDEHLSFNTYILNNESISEYKLQKIRKEFSKQMVQLLYFIPDLKTITVVNVEHQYLFSMGSMLNKHNSMSVKEYKNLLDLANSGVYFLKPQRSFWMDTDVYTGVRKFTNGNQSNEALVLLEMSINSLDKIFDKHRKKENYVFYIVEGQRQIYPLDNNYDDIHIPDQNNLLSRYNHEILPLDYCEWSLVLVSDNVIIQKQILSVTLINLILLIIVYIISSRTIKKFKIRMVEPIEQLLDFVKHNEIELDENNQDHLYLSELFGSIQNKHIQLQNELLKTKVKEQEAVMRALDAQINPHFLYNTLNAIGGAAEIYGPKVASEMSRNLANIMRYTIKYPLKVSLEIEIKHLKDYATLIKYMYGPNLTIVIDDCDFSQELIVPKLILQPLLENAIEHGFKNKEYPWHVSIKFSESRTFYLIEVLDNGCGFPNEKKEVIMQYYEALIMSQNIVIENDTPHLAIKNIISRFYDLYCNRFDFTISNCESVTAISYKILKEFKDD